MNVDHKKRTSSLGKRNNKYSKLMHQPREAFLSLYANNYVQNLLHQVWDSFIEIYTTKLKHKMKKPKNGFSREEYFDLYSRIIDVLLPHLDRKTAFWTLQCDWEIDSNGSDILTMEQFCKSWLLLADRWTMDETVNAVCHFIGWLYRQVFASFNFVAKTPCRKTSGRLNELIRIKRIPYKKLFFSNATEFDRLGSLSRLAAQRPKSAIAKGGGRRDIDWHQDFRPSSALPKYNGGEQRNTKTKPNGSTALTSNNAKKETIARVMEQHKRMLKKSPKSKRSSMQSWLTEKIKFEHYIASKKLRVKQLEPQQHAAVARPQTAPTKITIGGKETISERPKSAINRKLWQEQASTVLDMHLRPPIPVTHKNEITDEMSLCHSNSVISMESEIEEGYYENSRPITAPLVATSNELKPELLQGPNTASGSRESLFRNSFTSGVRAPKYETSKASKGVSDAYNEQKEKIGIAVPRECNIDWNIKQFDKKCTAKEARDELLNYLRIPQQSMNDATFDVNHNLGDALILDNTIRSGIARWHGPKARKLATLVGDHSRTSTRRMRLLASGYEKRVWNIVK